MPAEDRPEEVKPNILEVSPPATSTASESEDKTDRLLAKYVTVWIWSVLFGSSTGLVLSLITYRTDARWGPLNGVLLLFLLISVLASVISWRALLKYLRLYLIPKFLTPQTHDKGEEKKVYAEAADALERAFQYLIIAAVARVIMTLLEMAFASLAGSSLFQ